MDDKKIPIGFPETSRVLMNEMFSRHPYSHKWMYEFPQLDYNEDDWSDLIKMGVYSESGKLLKPDFFDEDDEDEDEDEDEGDMATIIKKSENDIKFSVKAIICRDYNANGDKRFLILKDAYSDYWDLPGGHLEDGESSDEALIREVNEETGLECDGHKEIFTRWMVLGKESKAVMFFFAKASGDVEVSEEHLDYEWITTNEMNDYNLGAFADIISEAFSDYDCDDLE